MRLKRTKNKYNEAKPYRVVNKYVKKQHKTTQDNANILGSY